ncbi:unnamed protein product, partial [Brassica oleracea]
GRARLSLGREETKDGHAFLSGGPSGQSRKRPYLYPVHPSDLRTNLFEEEGNDVPWFVDQSIGANQHGDQDVLNNLTEVPRLPRPTRHSKTHGRARLSLGREETKDGHAFLSGGPSGQSRKRPYLYPVHPSGSDEPGQ